MSTQGFDPLKRKIYWAYHQDGILDLVIGFVVLGFGTSMLTDNFAFLMASWFVMLTYYFLKKNITVPRFGYVQIDSRKKTQVRSWAALGGGMLILLLFFLLPIFLRRGPASPEIETWIRRYHMIPLSAVLFGLPSLVLAIFLGLKRFYLYALLAVSLPLFGAWLNIETYIPIMTTGTFMIAIGAVLLVIFLQKYPLEAEGGNGNG